MARAIDNVALGGKSDRQWVKDFGASDKSQAVYELAAWLDSLGLKLTIDVQYSEKFMADFREAQQDIENGDVAPFDLPFADFLNANEIH